MNNSKKRMIAIITLVIICCIVMAIIETIIEPAYALKSAMKVILFLVVPLVFTKIQSEKIFDNSFVLTGKSVSKLLALGSVIYIVIMGGYFLTKNFFDYSALVSSLSKDQQVSSGSFIWVALYISFCNSFLEEIMFRWFAFLKLSQYTRKSIAYIFSSVVFAVYHVAMIGTSFPIPLLLLALAGLAVGGFIFNYADAANKNIYNSWIIHMFADFAIMTIWYIHI